MQCAVNFSRSEKWNPRGSPLSDFMVVLLDCKIKELDLNLQVWIDISYLALLQELISFYPQTLEIKHTKLGLT